MGQECLECLLTHVLFPQLLLALKENNIKKKKNSPKQVSINQVEFDSV